MVSVSKLRGAISERGTSARAMAKHLGISDTTMYKKMQNGSFGCDEMYEIASVLGLSKEEKLAIFFATKDT